VELINRRREILEAAIEIIASEGYSKLTLRALARKSRLKLGALQYYFPTWSDLITELAEFVSEEYRHAFEQTKGSAEEPNLRDIVNFNLDDPPGSRLHSSRLFPQLWAMAQIEPALKSALDEIYGAYYERMKKSLREAGNLNPEIDGLLLMSLLEGSTLFVDSPHPWAEQREAFKKRVLEWLDAGSQ